MKEQPYKKLEKDYQHCIMRTMDLFRHGQYREYVLETGVANANKQFEAIKSMTDDKRIILICDEMSKFMLDVMSAKSIKDLET